MLIMSKWIKMARNHKITKSTTKMVYTQLQSCQNTSDGGSGSLESPVCNNYNNYNNYNNSVHGT